MAEEIAGNKSLAGGATVQLDERHFVGQALLQAWNLISRVCRWAAGSFIFCQTRAFREIGGFSHELFASEEIDLSKRLHVVGKRLGKRFVILHRHPIRTSARKIHLYSGREYLRFVARAALRPRQTLRSREACPTWYDGRR